MASDVFLAALTFFFFFFLSLAEAPSTALIASQRSKLRSTAERVTITARLFLLSRVTETTPLSLPPGGRDTVKGERGRIGEEKETRTQEESEVSGEKKEPSAQCEKKRK